MSTGPDGIPARERIANSIRADVISGVLAEGASLREQSLADQYGVSRAPIRDALLQLTQEGILVAKPNCGVRVANPDMESIQPLVVEMRREIELFTLDRVFDTLTEEDICELELTVERLREACQKEEVAAIVQHDMALHRYLIERTGQADLLAIWLPIVSRMLLHYTRHRSLLETHKEHARIVEAIRRRDKPATMQALMDNIQ